VTADEILGLSLALETTIGALMAPAEEDEMIDFADAGAIPGAAVRLSAMRNKIFGDAIRWDGDEPVFAPVTPEALAAASQMAAGAWPPAKAV
jgi:hypothetical protein